MSAMSELHMDTYTDMQRLRQLADLRIKLLSADILADDVRTRALRDHSSDEPYETAKELSTRIMQALSLVEIMLEDMGMVQ